jgi:hypothetical protein
MFGRPRGPGIGGQVDWRFFKCRPQARGLNVFPFCAMMR